MSFTPLTYASKTLSLFLDLVLIISGLVMIVVGAYSPPASADCPRMNSLPCVYNVLTWSCGLACYCGTTPCCYRECGDCTDPNWQGHTTCSQICGGICDPNREVGP